MSIKKVIITGSLIALSLFADEKGDQIAHRFYNLKSAKDSKATATMVLFSKNGSQRKRELKMIGKDSDNGTYSYIEFLSPADVKGTKFLVTPNADGESEQRLWLPALKKVRLISSSSKKGKFVGSDFSYYDLEDRDFDDATYKYLSEGTLDDGSACDLVEIVSKKDDCPYAKSVGYFRKSDGFAVKMDLYDKKSGKLAKKMVVIETKVIDGVIVPTKVVMDNVKGGTKTILITKDIVLNSGVDTSVFTVQNLQK